MLALAHNASGMESFLLVGVALTAFFSKHLQSFPLGQDSECHSALPTMPLDLLTAPLTYV